MRGYLERIAAAAMAPGGSFHPMSAALYGRRPEAQEPPEALPWEAPAARGERRVAASKAGSAGAVVERTGEAGWVGEEDPLRAAMGGVPEVEARNWSRESRAADFSTREVAEGASLMDTEARTSSFARAESAARGEAQGAVARPGSGEAAAEGVTADEALSSPSIASTRESQPAVGVPAKAVQGASPVGEERDRGFSSVGQRTFDSGSETSRAMAIPASSLPGQAEPLAASSFRDLPVASARQAGSDAVGYQPLVTRNAVASASSYVGATASESRGSGSRGVAPEQRSRPGERQREPDEIQIHIGRIEVTAAAPAPIARTQPAPARKTPSLNDYLRRGNGRA